MKKEKDADLVQLGAKIKKSTHKRLKHFCTDNDRDIQDVTEQAIDEFLERQEK